MKSISICKTIKVFCHTLVKNMLPERFFLKKTYKDWSDSITVSLFKGKEDVLDRSNYRGLKLTDLVLKVIERVVENIIRATVNIDKM